MSIALYEFAPTRSQRARWTLLELEVPFESISGRELIGSERLRAVHPLAKLPAMTDDGRPLFESAAISIWLADSHPEKGLIAAAGTWERALHDQWVAFALTELEAHLWSTFRNTVVYPEERRVAAISEQNAAEAKRGLAVFDDHLAGADHLVSDAFSVTDIIVAFALNWARRMELCDRAAHVERYLDRLYERPHCTLTRPN